MKIADEDKLYDLLKNNLPEKIIARHDEYVKVEVVLDHLRHAVAKTGAVAPIETDNVEFIKSLTLCFLTKEHIESIYGRKIIHKITG